MIAPLPTVPKRMESETRRNACLLPRRPQNALAEATPQCPAAWTDENQRVWVDALTYHVLSVLLQVTTKFVHEEHRNSERPQTGSRLRLWNDAHVTR